MILLKELELVFGHMRRHTDRQIEDKRTDRRGSLNSYLNRALAEESSSNSFV